MPSSATSEVNGVDAASDTKGLDGDEPQSDLPYVGSTHGFPRISRPVELLRYEYDVVVVGSGYGGGVAASRMARGGQSVCVLERGRERWPGEYPTTFVKAASELHFSGAFHPDDQEGVQLDVGNPIGLYHLVVGQGQNAFVANGLGGTSLLNANVFLPTDPKTQAMRVWPKELRKASELSKYYDRAAYMLQPEKYPDNFPTLPKLSLLEKQRDTFGSGKFYRVPQTTRFEDGPNNVGVEMNASTLSGMDSTGVNDGSKCSTLVNYLSDAWNWGAEMFCECEVRYVRKAKDRDGYNVFFTWHGSKRAEFGENIYEDLMWVHAKKLVFLGAGAIGSTEILLRSKQAGLPMSTSIGQSMSGNGDILAFGYNIDADVNSMGRENPLPARPIGPTITGVIDCRDQADALDGFVIEEGTVPAALTPILQSMLHQIPGKTYPSKNSIKTELNRQLAAVGSRILGPYYPKGSLERTQIYLIMSHDSNQAVLTLKNDKPVLSFLGVGRSDHVQYLNKVLADITNSFGGTFINNPFYAAIDQQEITVHPIGGACISSDGSGRMGATTHLGEVLAGEGEQFHDGLIVVDGAVIPTALGVNPFATITALAERSVEGVAKKKGIRIDYEAKNGVLNLFGPPAHPYPWKDNSVRKAERTIRDAKVSKAGEVSFTEVMSGYIYLGNDHKEYETATKAARGACQSAQFFLSVHAWDIKTLLSNTQHSAMLTGSFNHGSLPASPYMVLRGAFKLFNADPRTPDTTNLTYDFDMVGTDGSVIHFHGFKVVRPSIQGSLIATWNATTTLYVTLTKPPSKKIVGRGIINVHVSDFGSELKSFNVAGPTTLTRLSAAAGFLFYFAKNVFKNFLGPFSPLQWPAPTVVAYRRTTLPTKTYHIIAADKVRTTMRYWDPAPDTKPSPVSMLLIPGAAVDYQIFAMPTVEHNAVEHFTKAGYPVYCVTTRVGKTTVAKNGWTAYDARLDVKAALEKIRQLQGSNESIYVVGHCAGSVAFSSGLLDGAIPAEWIKGITASNVFFNPIFATVNKIKARSPISLSWVYNTLVGPWFSCTSSQEDPLIQRLLDQALRFYPAGAKQEFCNSVVCHRSELAFGRLWSHNNLNSATHSQLDRFLGGTSMNALTHLVQTGLAGVNLTNPPHGQSLVTNGNLERLKGIPIFLFSGSENSVYSPESTSTSYSKLRDRFGADNYQCVIFQGKGHLDCWMSDSANDDVFPRVLEHVNYVCKLTEKGAPVSVKGDVTVAVNGIIND